MNTQYTATFTQTSCAMPMGKYTPTTVDENKQNVDFRIMQMSPIYIRWADGSGEIVTPAKLKKLQAKHTFTTDF
jgi:hypothetical protein